VQRFFTATSLKSLDIGHDCVFASNGSLDSKVLYGRVIPNSTVTQMALEQFLTSNCHRDVDAFSPSLPICLLSLPRCHSTQGCHRQEPHRQANAPLNRRGTNRTAAALRPVLRQRIQFPSQPIRDRVNRVSPSMAGGSRKSRSAAGGPAAPSTTLVLDNGADTIKAGLIPTGSSGGDDNTPTQLQPRIIPNCIARDRHKKIYVASELDKCRDFGEMAFRRPVEKGYIVNWEAQKEIWEREFFDEKAPLRCDPAETRLVLAEQPNALPALQTHCDQMVFEEFGFASYVRGIGACALF